MTDQFILTGPLYQLSEDLPTCFLKISQSEIINTKEIDHLHFTSGGSVQIYLKNGSLTYSSRRYLKAIKEKLSNCNLIINLLKVKDLCLIGCFFFFSYFLN